MRYIFLLLTLFTNLTILAQSRPLASRPKPAPPVSQTKPELTFDYFDKINYTPPENLTVSDSIRLASEVARLTQLVKQVTDSAMLGLARLPGI